MSSAGRGLSRQKMVSVGTSIVPPGPRPSPADTPGPSTAATTPQVTASLHDFAVSLPKNRTLGLLLGRAGDATVTPHRLHAFSICPPHPWCCYKHLSAANQ